MRYLWELTVRFRTYVANLFFAVMIVAPDLLNSPELLALFPDGYQRYVIAACFLVNIWLRPRPAVMAKDPEVAAKRKTETEFTGGEV